MIKSAIVFILCFTEYALSQTEKSILLTLEPKEIVETFKNVISSKYIREMANQMANKAAQQFIQNMKFKKMRFDNKGILMNTQSLSRQGEDLREVIEESEKRQFDDKIKYDTVANISTKELRLKPRERPIQNAYQQQDVRVIYPSNDMKPLQPAVPPQTNQDKYSDEVRQPPNKIMLQFESSQGSSNHRPAENIQVSAEKEEQQPKLSPLHVNGNDVPVVKEDNVQRYKKVDKEDTKHFAPYRDSQKVDVTHASDHSISLPKPPYQKKKRLRPKSPRTEKTLLDENVAFALLKEPSPDGDDWELNSLEISEIKNDIPVVEVKKINGVYFRRFLGSLPIE